MQLKGPQPSVTHVTLASGYFELAQVPISLKVAARGTWNPFDSSYSDTHPITQARSTSNAATLRVSFLNSTATR